MNKFIDFLYCTEHCEFVSNLPIEIAIKRLEKNMEKTAESSFSSKQMLGSVSKENTKIECSSMFGNIYKPLFFGSFKTKENQTVLSGVFRIQRLSQVFMTFWYGAHGLSIPFYLYYMIVEPLRETWFIPLFYVLVIASGVGMIKLGQLFSYNDKKLISEFISNSIIQNYNPHNKDET